MKQSEEDRQEAIKNWSALCHTCASNKKLISDLTSSGNKLIERIRLWQRGVAEGVEVISIANELEQSLSLAKKEGF